MTRPPAWTWLLLFLLGAWHGINPAMGWLFAVGLGLQRQSGRAVWQSLIPIATGHLAAIVLAVSVAVALGMIFPLLYIKIAVAILLISFGIYRIAGKGHVRWGGMQVGFKDLTIWSFLMASAHGAGLMLLPIVLAMPVTHDAHATHLARFAQSALPIQFLGVLIHTFGYLLVTGLSAWIVYTRLGLSLLRQAWFNVDLLWSVALIATACFILATSI
jgi:hypothetical protein